MATSPVDKPSGHSSPALRQWHALGLLVFYTLVYVLPLHASPSTRASSTRSRDSPDAIRARVRSVSLSTAACSLASLCIVYYLPAQSNDSPLHLLGYWPVGLYETATSLLLTALLFVGPLYERFVVDGAWRYSDGFKPFTSIWHDWTVWRFLVAGPITEECLFRSAGVPLLLYAGATLRTTIFVSPVVFGLAHVNHFLEFRIANPRVPVFAAVARSVLQFSYTTLFGVYATFLYLRTGSLLAVVIVHAFCNFMGLPRFWGAVEPHWLTAEELERPGLGVWRWTLLYYVLLVAGAAGWWQNLYTLTESDMALARF